MARLASPVPPESLTLPETRKPPLDRCAQPADHHRIPLGLRQGLLVGRGRLEQPEHEAGDQGDEARHADEPGETAGRHQPFPVAGPPAGGRRAVHRLTRVRDPSEPFEADVEVELVGADGGGLEHQGGGLAVGGAIHLGARRGI